MRKKVLILSGILWEDTYQRHQSIANYIASQGYEVIFVEGIPSSKFTFKKMWNYLNKKIKNRAETHKSSTEKNYAHENINVKKYGYINPGRALNGLNRLVANRMIKELGRDYEIVINYLPIETTKYIIDKVKCNMKIYDCVRDFVNWGGYCESVLKIENRMIKEFEYIMVDSYYLLNKFNAYRDKVVQILPMVTKNEVKIYKDCTAKKQIRNIVYFGSVDFHINVDMLNELSSKGYEIHLIGDINRNLLINDRIKIYGFVKDLEELAKKIAELADAIIIPYKGNMDGVIPAKLMQSIATELPVFINSFYDSEYLSDYLYVYKDINHLEWLLKKYSLDEHRDKKYIMNKFINNHLAEEQYKQIDQIIKE